jgi:hypothetical protein
MTATDVVNTVREENRTELSRLGSSKSLYADTEGEMEPETVLTAAANGADSAAGTFEGWATDEDVAGTFAAAAEGARERYEAVADKLGGHESGDTPAVVAALADLSSAVERLGGLVGWALVLETKTTQMSGFFTGQADPQTASLFRGFGEEYEAIRADAVDTLEEVCEGEDDWDRAVAAASDVVGAAYDEYFETLESLGINPKPVC